MRYKKPTSTDYPKFFIEDKDVKVDLTDMDILRSRKSNLILSLERMERGERRKAAEQVIVMELQLATIKLERGEARGACFNLVSAINTRKYCRWFKPGIANELLERAWKKRDPWILLGTTLKKAKKDQ